MEEKNKTATVGDLVFVGLVMMIFLCSFIYLTISISTSDNGKNEDEYSAMKREYKKYADYHDRYWVGRIYISNLEKATMYCFIGHIKKENLIEAIYNHIYFPYNGKREYNGEPTLPFSTSSNISEGYSEYQDFYEASEIINNMISSGYTYRDGAGRYMFCVYIIYGDGTLEENIMDDNYFVYKYIEGRDFGWAIHYDPILEKWTRYYTDDELSRLSRIITVDIPTTVTIDIPETEGTFREEKNEYQKTDIHFLSKWKDFNTWKGVWNSFPLWGKIVIIIGILVIFLEPEIKKREE